MELQDREQAQEDRPELKILRADRYILPAGNRKGEGERKMGSLPYDQRREQGLHSTRTEPGPEICIPKTDPELGMTRFLRRLP